MDNGKDTISDSTADLIWPHIDSESDLSREEGKNNDDDPSHSDWALTSTSNLKRILDYSVSPGTTGYTANGVMFTQLPYQRQLAKVTTPKAFLKQTGML